MGTLAVIPRDWRYPVVYRSSLENPQTPLSYPAEWLLDMFNGGRTDSGIRVSELTAFQTTTFLACVDLISSKVGALPRHIFERKVMASGRTKHRIAFEHDYYDLVSLEPNPEMNSNTLIKALLIHCLAWGNGYIEIQRDAGGGAVALWPRNPAKTRPRRMNVVTRLEPVPWRPYPWTLEAGEMAFETTDGLNHDDTSSDGSETAAGRLIPMDDMIHIQGLSFDGRVGSSTVWLSRQTLGLALALEKFGAKYFANYARPGGILVAPANQSSADREKSRQSWLEAQGGENMNRVAVMGPGWEWKAMSNSPQEAMTIDARKFTRNEICSIFRVPPHMVGDVDKGRSNTEQLAQELKEYCFDPWLSAIKIEFKRKLFPHRKIGRVPRSPFFMDFDLSELLRPDAKSRQEYYHGGKLDGWLNANDIREREKLNPIEDDNVGEVYWMPVNYTLADTPVDPTSDPGGDSGGSTGPKPKPKKKNALSEPLAIGYLRMFHDGLGRAMARDRRDIKIFQSCLGPVLYAVRDSVAQEAESTFGIRFQAGSESERTVGDYLGGLMQRSAKYAEIVNNDGEVSTRIELERAIRMIRVAVYRECAAAKARQAEIDELQSDAEFEADAQNEEITDVARQAEIDERQARVKAKAEADKAKAELAVVR